MRVTLCYWLRFCAAFLNFAVIVCQYSSDGYHSLVQPYEDNSDVQSLTYCRISTRDLITTAQATANRVLQGVCNPRQLNDRFIDLEKQIVDQFNVLKTMVLNIEDKLRDQDKKIKGQHRKLHRAVAGSKPSRRDSTYGDEVGHNALFEGGHEPYNDFYDEGEEGFNHELQFPVSASVREKEISQYNSSIHHQDGKRVFLYYWTVHDLAYRTKNWGWRRSLRSDSFYVFQFGYRMYIRIFPNHNGTNIYIHVGITKGDYDTALDWPFKLKHQIQILDHQIPGDDITSRVWDPTQLCSGWNWRKPETGDNYECVGLGFPQEMLKSRKYLHNDSVTVKLTVFLD